MLKFTAFCSTVCAAALLASAAMAADAPAPIAHVQPTFVGPAIYDWTGPYVGENAGLSGGTFAHPFSLVDPADPANVFLDGSADVTGYGLTGGAQAGFNYQMDNVVFGVEGDIQLTSLQGAVDFTLTDVTGVLGAPGDVYGAHAGTSVDWLATLRPRLGMAHDRMLVYVTGGLAYADVTSSVDVTFNGTPVLAESETGSRWGYTVGAGVEYAFNDTVSLKTEYLYTDLGSGNLFDNGFFSIDNSVSFHTVRAGVNVHF